MEENKAQKKIPLVVLRVVIGWYFVYTGWTKVVTFFTDTPDWSAQDFLGNLDGPFAPFFSGMMGNAVIDYLNAFGLFLVGVAVSLGILTRFACYCGILLMTLYYLAGFPPERAFIVDNHLIFIGVFLVLAAESAGRYWGIDQYVEKFFVAKRNKLFSLFGH